MQLRMTVSSVQAPSLGPDGCATFRLRGGTIGRARDNDWILPDPERIVSSHHARIHYDQGVYAIEDTSSNGTSLNREDNVLPKGKKVPLTHGDILYIGEYAVQVELVEDAPTPPTPRQKARPPAPDFVAKPYISREPEGRDECGGGFAPAAGGPSPSPLARDYPHEEARRPSPLLPSPRQPPPQGPSRSDHVPADKEHFRPPGARPEPMPEEMPGPIQVTLPEDWMLETGLGTAPPAPSRAASPPTPAPAPAPVAAETEAPPAGPPPASGGRHAPAAAPQAPPAAELPPSAVETIPGASPPEAPPQPAARLHAPMAASALVAGAAGPPAAAFFEGLGIDPAPLSAEQSDALLRRVGRLMRLLTQGVMGLLKTRSELKNEFRLAATIVGGRAEYNPLKHLPDAGVALEQFFLEPRPGSMGPEAAFTEALKDIEQHEFAVLAGMRAAFDRLLDRLAPEEVEAAFRARGKQGLWHFGDRTWDFYRAFYADFKANAADDFEGIFGKDFVRAYEEQVSRLSGGDEEP